VLTRERTLHHACQGGVTVPGAQEGWSERTKLADAVARSRTELKITGDPTSRRM
jgi:hypothetical protein